MEIYCLPSFEDFWSDYTRIKKIASHMTKNLFFIISHNLHFGDNSNVNSTNRFFKILPVFGQVTRACQKFKDDYCILYSVRLRFIYSS